MKSKINLNDKFRTGEGTVVGLYGADTNDNS